MPKREAGLALERFAPFVRGLGVRLIGGVLNRPRRCLAALMLLTLPLAGGMLRLQLRTDGAAVYPRRDPVVEHTRTDRLTFHETDQVIVLLTPRSASRLDTREGLEFIERLHTSLETLPGVERIRLRSVASLIDARPGTPLILAKPLLDAIPDDPQAFANLLQRLREPVLSRGLFLSPDGGAAAIYVSMASHQERARFVERLEGWARDSGTPAFDVRLTGPVTVEVIFGRKVLGELARLVPLMVLIIAALLYACFRSGLAVLVVLVQAGMVLVWTLGAMGICGVPVTLVTTILPVVLMTMGVTDEIYLLERIHRRFGERSGPDARGAETEQVRAAIESALAEISHPMLITSLTTAAGFLSFVAASADPIRHFGEFTALGIVVALVFTFTLVPAMLLVLPPRWVAPAPRPSSTTPRFDRLERALVLQDGVGALVGCCLFMALAPGLSRLSVQDSWIDNLEPGSALVSADRTFNAHFWGSYRFDIVLTGPRLLFFHEREGLRLLERISGVAAGAPHVGGVVSSLVAFDIAARAEGRTGPVSELPADTLVGYSQLLQMASRQTDLDQVLNFDGRVARVRLFVKDADFARTRQLEDYLQREIPAAIAGSPVPYHFSGDLPATQSAVGAIVGNLLRAVAWTLVLVGALLAVAFRSLGSALRGLVPVCTGILMVLGGMGYAGVPLGLATSMFVAVAVGVGVDFSIHFRHAYRRHRGTGLDHRGALSRLMAGTGRALRWNTIVLSVGLLVLSLSGLRPNRSLGILLSATLAVCYGTTLLLLPLLMRFERPVAAGQAPGEMR